MDLMENNGKYEVDQRHLTVKDIVGTDEGNYSCINDQEAYYTGCLLVYGKSNIYHFFCFLLCFNSIFFQVAHPLVWKTETSKFPRKGQYPLIFHCRLHTLDQP